MYLLFITNIAVIFPLLPGSSGSAFRGSLEETLIFNRKIGTSSFRGSKELSAVVII